MQTTTDLLYSLYSSLFDSIYLIPDTNSWFWKLQPLWGRERRRKICERGVPGNFYLAQPPYIHIYIYMCVCVCVCLYCIYLFIFDIIRVYIYILTHNSTMPPRHSVLTGRYMAPECFDESLGPLTVTPGFNVATHWVSYCWWFRIPAPVIGRSSHYLQGFIHPRWCRIAFSNSISLMESHVSENSIAVATHLMRT